MLRFTLLVLGKELRETLRDRMVLLFSFGFPMVFYPVLMWGTFQLMFLQMGDMERHPPRLDVTGPQELLDELLAEPALAADGGHSGLDAGTVDAVVVAVGDADGLDVTVWYHSARQRSRRAEDLVDDRLDELRVVRRNEMALLHGWQPADLQVWSIRVEDQAPPEELLGYALSMALPMILMILSLMACLYPAVEVVVGERERSTLETTMVAACPRLAVVLGKALTVQIIAMTSLLGTVLAMGITVVHGLHIVLPDEELTMQLAPGPTLMAAVVMATMLMLAVSLVLLVVLPARNFKQGQTLASLVLLLGMAPIAVVFLPDLTLTPALAAVPVVNAVMVLKESLAGQLSLPLAAMAAVINVAWAVAVMGAAVLVTRRESYLFPGAATPRWLAWIGRSRDRS